MKTIISEKLEQGRIRNGYYASKTGDTYGAFRINLSGADLVILSSGEEENEGWEHVSVSLAHRTPNWREMCFVKDLFWNDNECVIQYHPPRSDYINHHPYCLHLWRPTAQIIPMPPAIFVGPRDTIT